MAGIKKLLERISPYVNYLLIDSECATGEDQYPKTPVSEKLAYWTQIESTFRGLLVDFSISKINETAISTMLARKPLY